MQIPKFWNNDTLSSKMLAPLAWLYGKIIVLRSQNTKPKKIDIPVMCIGNATIGGAGKTPRTIAGQLRRGQGSGRRPAQVWRLQARRIPRPHRPRRLRSVVQLDSQLGRSHHAGMTFAQLLLGERFQRAHQPTGVIGRQ